MCWIVPKGKKLVGFDASGLELRMLAHYMDDEDYTNEILTGDIHTANQIAAGLKERSQAKTFIYAFLYGAGDAKIGSVVGGSARDGNALKQRFLSNTPALASLRERVGRAVGKGYLIGLDGRKLWVRSEHSALNTLLQAAGAIVMKKALVLLDEQAKGQDFNFKFVGNVHDEVQAEVDEQQAEAFGELAVSCLKQAGEAFGLRCPLDGEYKIGDNWSETH
jgi:DNA polymerase I-like protein with 3'-5' exonuclease and polymerase domains